MTWPKASSTSLSTYEQTRFKPALLIDVFTIRTTASKTTSSPMSMIQSKRGTSRLPAWDNTWYKRNARTHDVSKIATLTRRVLVKKLRSVSDGVSNPSGAVMYVTVVIPTYCEASNIHDIALASYRALRSANLDGEIVVVDDNSPDGTAKIALQLADRVPVRVKVRRGRRDLSGAVMEGLRMARGEIVVVMDADFSHPPEMIPDLVAAIQQTHADFVIGSRYCQGGSIESGWSPLRRLNSKLATLLARPLTTATDPMAGFFAVRRKDALAADLNPIGYKIGLELMIKCGFKDVRELPISFRDRIHGESKLTWREQLKYVQHLHRLYEFRFGWLVQAILFCLVGLTGMCVDLVLFASTRSVFGLGLSRALSIWAAMSWNFWLNRVVTFVAMGRDHEIRRQYWSFCLACLVGGAVNWTVTMLLCSHSTFFHNHNLPAACIGILAGTALNFTACKVLVFSSRDQTSKVFRWPTWILFGFADSDKSSAGVVGRHRTHDENSEIGRLANRTSAPYSRNRPQRNLSNKVGAAGDGWCDSHRSDHHTPPNFSDIE